MEKVREGATPGLKLQENDRPSLGALSSNTYSKLCSQGTGNSCLSTPDGKGVVQINKENSGPPDVRARKAPASPAGGAKARLASPAGKRRGGTHRHCVSTALSPVGNPRCKGAPAHGQTGGAVSINHQQPKSLHADTAALLQDSREDLLGPSGEGELTPPPRWMASPQASPSHDYQGSGQTPPSILRTELAILRKSRARWQNRALAFASEARRRRQAEKELAAALGEVVELKAALLRSRATHVADKARFHRAAVMLRCALSLPLPAVAAKQPAAPAEDAETADFEWPHESTKGPQEQAPPATSCATPVQDEAMSHTLGPSLPSLHDGGRSVSPPRKADSPELIVAIQKRRRRVKSETWAADTLNALTASAQKGQRALSIRNKYQVPGYGGPQKPPRRAATSVNFPSSLTTTTTLTSFFSRIVSSYTTSPTLMSSFHTPPPRHRRSATCSFPQRSAKDANGPEPEQEDFAVTGSLKEEGSFPFLIFDSPPIGGEGNQLSSSPLLHPEMLKDEAGSVEGGAARLIFWSPMPEKVKKKPLGSEQQIKGTEDGGVALVADGVGVGEIGNDSLSPISLL